MVPGDLPTEARVFPTIRQSWTNMWPSFWILLGLTLVTVIATRLPGLPAQFPIHWSLQLAFGGVGLLSAILLGGPLGIGVTQANLTVSRGQKPAWSDLKLGFQRYGQAVLLTLLTFLIVLGGFILLVLPGIYLAVRLQFVTQRFVEDGMGAVESIKASFEDTRGRFWSVFGLGFMSFLLVIAGLLAFGIGVFVAMVWVGQLVPVYWRAIDQRP